MHRLLGDQLVLHVNGELDVVADAHLGHARHRAGIRIGERDLLGAGALHLAQQRLLPVTLALDGCNLLGQLAVTPTGTAARRVVIVGVSLIESLHVPGELLVGLPDEPGERGASKVAVLVIDRLDARTVHRHELAPEQVELAAQHHELAEHRLEGGTVVAAEIGNRLEVRLEVPQQPDHLDVAVGLGFQAPA